MSAQRRPEPQRPVDPIVAALRDARVERGTSQLTLALEMGVSQPVLSAWEVGKNQPGLAMLRRWTALLGLDLILAGTVDEPAGAVYARGWDDCAAAATAAIRREARDA